MVEINLSCGVLVLPDNILQVNAKQQNNAEIQQKRFEAFNDFCKKNMLLPTPESMKAFLTIEKYKEKRGIN